MPVSKRAITQLLRREPSSTEEATKALRTLYFERLLHRIQPLFTARAGRSSSEEDITSAARTMAQNLLDRSDHVESLVSFPRHHYFPAERAHLLSDFLDDFYGPSTLTRVIEKRYLSLCKQFPSGNSAAAKKIRNTLAWVAHHQFGKCQVSKERPIQAHKPHVCLLSIPEGFSVILDYTETDKVIYWIRCKSKALLNPWKAKRKGRYKVVSPLIKVEGVHISANCVEASIKLDALNEIRLVRSIDTQREAFKALPRVADSGILMLGYDKSHDDHRLLTVQSVFIHGDLASFLTSLPPGSLLLSQVHLIMCECAQAVEQCHSIDYVHGDIKPTQFLVDDDYHVFLGDHDNWGSPKERHLTSAFLAPDRSHSKSSDVWALGLTLFLIANSYCPPSFIDTAPAEDEIQHSIETSRDFFGNQAFLYLMKGCFAKQETRFSAKEVCRVLERLGTYERLPLFKDNSGLDPRVVLGLTS